MTLTDADCEDKGSCIWLRIVFDGYSFSGDEHVVFTTRQLFS